MALENIGLGGVLSFETRGAISNMSAASRAFQVLGNSAQRATSSVNRMASGFSAFNFVGAAGLMAGTAAVGSWIKSGIEFNGTMETAELSIATIMGIVTKTPLADNIDKARIAVSKLNVIAAQTPGELTDVSKVFQSMTGPILSAGGSMDDLFNQTKGVMIMAGALKRPFQQAGQDMAKLANGAFEAGNDLHLALRSMGLLKETTQQWKALLPEQRLKRMNEILGAFAEAGERVQQTWEAQSSTFKSIVKQVAGAFTRNMFDQMKTSVGGINDAFFKNSEAILKRANEMGAQFGKVIGFFADQVRKFAATIQRTFNRIQMLMDRLGVSIDMEVVKKVAAVASQFLLVMAAVSPVITVVGFLGSKIMALWSIVSGLGGLLAALAPILLPVAAIVGGIFLLFRKGNEGPVAFFMRAMEAIKKFAIGLYNDMKPGLDALHAAAVGVFTFIKTALVEIGVIARMLFDGFARAFEAIRPGLMVLFNAVAKFIKVIVDGINLIFPKIMAVLRPVMEVLMDIGVALARMWGKILSLLGPVFDLMSYIFKEILFPIGAWLVDTFGPVFVFLWQVVGAIIEGVADAIGFIADVLKFVGELLVGAFKLAWEGIKAVVDAIASVIGWIADKLSFIGDALSWVADKVGGVVGKVGDAIGAVGDFLFGGSSILDLYQQQMNKTKQSAEEMGAAVERAVFATNLAMMQAKLSAMSTQEVVAGIVSMVENLYAATVEPFAKLGAQVINMVADAKIVAKQPDVKVDVNVANKSTLCVNGRNLAVAQSDYETEVSERAGFNKTPWQTQRVQIAGVDPSK